MRRLTWIVLFALAPVLVVVAAIYLWPRMPGSFYRDSSGNAHGTGSMTYRYKGGAPQLVEDYSSGKLVRSEWFKPDGTSVQITQWNDESGEWLKLREDGSIERRMEMVRGIAGGKATFYAADGSILGTAEYKDGVRVSGYDPKAPSP